MVQRVERFDLERRVSPVIDVETLADSKIQVPVPGTRENSDTGVAELSARRGREAGDVDPRVVGAGAIYRAVADTVRTLERSCRLKRLARAVVHGDGKAGMRLEDTVDGPAAQDGIRHAARV